MNRARRRAQMRARRDRGRGWTRKPGKARSWEQIRLTGIGERRMVAIARNLHRLPLRRREAERKAA